MTIGLRWWIGARVRLDINLGALRKLVGQRVAELCQAHLQGTETLWQDGRSWDGDGDRGGGGGRRRGKSLAARVCLAAG